MQKGGRGLGLILLVALVGAIVGNLAGQLLPPSWPAVTRVTPMGVTQPVVIDLGVLTFTFGFTMNLTLAGAAGLVVALAIMLRRA